MDGEGKIKAPNETCWKVSTTILRKGDAVYKLEKLQWCHVKGFSIRSTAAIDSSPNFYYIPERVLRQWTVVRALEAWFSFCYPFRYLMNYLHFIPNLDEGGYFSSFIGPYY